MTDCSTEPSADLLSDQQQPTGPAQRILYLGPDLSFSYAAAHAVFPGPNQELVKAESFNDIFRRLQNSAKHPPHGYLDGERYDYAIVPVANSTNGPVLPVVDLLRRCGDGTLLEQISKRGVKGLNGTMTDESAPDDSAALYLEESSTPNHETPIPSPASNVTYPDIIIRKPYNYALAVHHYLYVHPNCPIPANDTDTSTSTPNTDPSISTLIASLHTHPQVWTQCTRFLATHFPNAHFPDSAASPPPSPPRTPPQPTPTKHDHPSTSSAALYVAEHGATAAASAAASSHTSDPPNDPSPQGYPAAICSRLAGESRDLKCVAAHIEDDREGNCTTFVVLGVGRSEEVGLREGEGEGKGRRELGT